MSQEKYWIEEFYEIPWEDVPGEIGDAFDILCKIEQVDGGIDVYYCKDDDEFEAADTPTFRLFGDQKTTRMMLLQYLLYGRLLIAAHGLSIEFPAAFLKLRTWLEDPMKLWYKPELVDEWIAKAQTEAHE